MPATQQVRVQAIASGLVQGIGYRWFVIERARDLGLSGWVRNLPDGRVEAEIEGPIEAVDKLVEAMKKGPMMAHVTGVAVAPLTYEGKQKDFQVRH